ncbi:glucosamine-6-phosphate deaminase [Paenibacillus glycinis]|uniref:Glucosamine-6-phosphate deaminase n=1 Tax=Paenibacillus glycinis TaxID=2697035 RepID=A0ABW9XNS5_9BACL|nr:glucosamine-6-phosphate deaminase [Paenibacillus glycinis]NBD24292.1 glucosamine-6-phosphate deaminase [Paenibacillus glycinis]
MKVHILPLEHIGPYIADQVTHTASAKPEALIAWTTGNTPLRTGIYRELIAREQANGLDLSSCWFVNPDEQIGIPRAHEESYYTYMKRHFFDHIRHSEDRRFIPDGAAADAAAECERMEQFIEDHGGIDYQLVGIGINGHICFIEPAASLPARCFVTDIADVNRRLYAPLFGGKLEDVPETAITFGWGTVMKSRRISLVAVGKDKAEIVARALLGPITTELPATLLQLHPNAEIVLDEAAAALYLQAQAEAAERRGARA